MFKYKLKLFGDTHSLIQQITKPLGFESKNLIDFSSLVEFPFTEKTF